MVDTTELDRMTRELREKWETLAAGMSEEEQHLYPGMSPFDYTLVVEDQRTLEGALHHTKRHLNALSEMEAQLGKIRRGEFHFEFEIGEQALWLWGIPTVILDRRFDPRPGFPILYQVDRFIVGCWTEEKYLKKMGGIQPK